MQTCRILILLLVVTTNIFAEDVGIVSFVQGKPVVRGAGIKSEEVLRLGSLLKKGQTIETKEGILEIQLATQSTIRVEKFTILTVQELLDPKSKASTLRLVGGKLFVKVHKENAPQGSSLKVVTPSFVAGVRGTEFLVATPDQGGQNEDLPLDPGVYVNEGVVAVSPDAKAKPVLVKENEEVVLSGKVLQKQILDEFAKEKMKIFENFQALQKENYERIKEQNLKNLELMNEFRGKKE